MLILNNNPFIGNYMVVKELEFSPSLGIGYVSFPSSYQDGDSLCYSAMIKQIRKIYVWSDLVSDGFDYFVGVTVANEAANKQFRFDIVLPSCVISYGNYSVTYTIIVVDLTTLNNNLPRFQLEANMLTTSVGGNNVGMSFSKNVFFADFNIFLGIGQYYFYNHR